MLTNIVETIFCTNYIRLMTYLMIFVKIGVGVEDTDRQEQGGKTERVHGVVS